MNRIFYKLSSTTPGPLFSPSTSSSHTWLAEKLTGRWKWSPDLHKSQPALLPPKERSITSIALSASCQRQHCLNTRYPSTLGGTTSVTDPKSQSLSLSVLYVWLSVFVCMRLALRPYRLYMLWFSFFCLLLWYIILIPPRVAYLSLLFCPLRIQQYPVPIKNGFSSFFVRLHSASVSCIRILLVFLVVLVLCFFYLLVNLHPLHPFTGLGPLLFSSSSCLLLLLNFFC